MRKIKPAKSEFEKRKIGGTASRHAANNLEYEIERLNRSLGWKVVGTTFNKLSWVLPNHPNRTLLPRKMVLLEFQDNLLFHPPPG